MEEYKKTLIPINVAKEIAEKYDRDMIIILTVDEDSSQNIVTYGKSNSDSIKAALFGNNLKRLLGWSEEFCNAIPSRKLNDEEKELCSKKMNLNEILTL